MPYYLNGHLSFCGIDTAAVLAFILHSPRTDESEASGIQAAAFRACHAVGSHSPTDLSARENDDWAAMMCLHWAPRYLWSGQSQVQRCPNLVTAYPDFPVWDRTK